MLLDGKEVIAEVFAVEEVEPPEPMVLNKKRKQSLGFVEGKFVERLNVPIYMAFHGFLEYRLNIVGVLDEILDPAPRIPLIDFGIIANLDVQSLLIDSFLRTFLCFHGVAVLKTSSKTCYRGE
jgi:hypothetical protein